MVKQLDKDARLKFPCDTPGCDNDVVVPKNYTASTTSYVFCKHCRAKYSYRVLVTQVQHGYGIKEVLLDAATLFTNVSGIAVQALVYLQISQLLCSEHPRIRL